MEELVISMSGVRRPTTDDSLGQELSESLEGEEHGGKHIKLDMRQVKYVTSTDVESLLRLHKKTDRNGGKLTLVNVTGHTLEVLEVCKLDKFLNIER